MVQHLTDKLDDLETRSNINNNNIRIVGLPEQYKASELKDICEQTIPKALGIKTTCTVESAHRLGQINPDKENADKR